MENRDRRWGESRKYGAQVAQGKDEKGESSSVSRERRKKPKRMLNIPIEMVGRTLNENRKKKSGVGQRTEREQTRRVKS